MQWSRLACVLLAAALSSTSAGAQSARLAAAWEWVAPAPLDAATAEQLFTLYDGGNYADFESVVVPLASSLTNPFEFEAHAENWIAAGPEPRRAFVAAAVALELATAQQPRSGVDARTTIQMNFALAEVGCAFLRDHPPSPGERSWHAAFVALARARGREDQVSTPPAMAVANPAYARALARIQADERHEYQQLMERVRQSASRTSRSSRIEMSRQRAEHGRHLSARFADDPHQAFVNALIREKALSGVDETLLRSRHTTVWLDTAAVDRLAKGGVEQVKTVRPNQRMDRASAERLYRVLPELRGAYDPADQWWVQAPGSSPAIGIALSLALWDVADALRAVTTQEAVAAEAFLRLGQTYVRLARPDLALPALQLAESLATSPSERYLARLFTGAVFEHAGRRSDAIDAFRGALEVVPRAQSASIALAPLLLQIDEGEEAAALLDASLKLPLTADPLQYYYQGGPDALPRALVKLRTEAVR